MREQFEQSVEGHIFNIQRGCTKDGPGIRTTVFSKAVCCDVNGVTIPNLLYLRRNSLLRGKNAPFAAAVSKRVPMSVTACGSEVIN